MKTIEISKGGTTAVKIELHDPELSVVVHDAVAVDAQEEVKELPVRMLYKGQRVRNLREINHVKKGATGTVDEDGVVPWVIWDSPEMLTDLGRWRENRRWAQDSGFLEVIEEVKELPYLSNPSDTNPDERPDYSHLIGKWVKCIYVEDNKKGTIEISRAARSLNKWFKVVGLYNLFKDSIVIEHPDGVDVFNVKHFDLSNPRDTNPDEPREVKVPFDASRMAEAVRFETRAGQEVKCVVANDVEAEYPVTGYLNGWLTWTNDGRFSTTGAQRPLDLFMVVQEVRND